MLLAGTANAGVTAIRQTLDYTHNAKWGEPWFIPPGVVTDHSPYHRGMWEDWGWTHDVRGRVPGDAKGILSATLTINAWDVADLRPDAPEIHMIYANGIELGRLEQTPPRAWGITQFELPQEVLDQLWDDRQVYIFMNIDSVVDMVGQRVTLEYSTLTVNYSVTGKGTPSRLSVHRFWSEALSTYFYTANETEKENLIKDTAGGWVYQGVEYRALPAEFEPDSAPVYCFWSDVFKTHLYTIDPAMRDTINEKFSSVWTDRGEAFWAFPPDVEVTGTIPVYRFRSDSIRRYFYTLNEAQRDQIILDHSDVWTYEGIAWHAYPYQPAP
jgi:hypothetical protein